MPDVEMPDGSIVSFPASMKSADIERALRTDPAFKRFNQRATAPTAGTRTGGQEGRPARPRTNQADVDALMQTLAPLPAQANRYRRNLAVGPKATPDYRLRRAAPKTAPPSPDIRGIPVGRSATGPAQAVAQTLNQPLLPIATKANTLPGAVSRAVAGLSTPANLGLAALVPATGGLSAAIPRLLQLGFGAQAVKNFADQVQAGQPWDAAISGLFGAGMLHGGLQPRGRGTAVTTPKAEAPTAPATVTHGGRTFDLVDTKSGKPVYRLRPQEVQGAAQEGQVPKGRVGEHPRDDQVRPSAEAGGGGGVGERPAVGRQVPQAKAEAPQEVAPGRTTGVAERVRTGMAEQGRAAPYQAGHGASAAEMKARGEQLIRGGTDPQGHLSMMESRGTAVSSDDMAILAAHDDALVRATDLARDARRSNPSDPGLQASYEQAKAAEQDWYSRTSTFRTEWQRIGAAQQGEVDIDTGEFSTTRFERYVDAVRKGKPLSTSETATMDRQTARIETLQNELNATRAKLDQALKGTAGTAPKSKLPTDPVKLAAVLQERIQNGTFRVGAKLPKQTGAIPRGRGNVAPDIARAIWGYAKERYLDPAVARNERADFDDMVNAVGKDLGLTPQLVREAFASNKTVRDASIQMYRQMSERRSAILKAKSWAQDSTMAFPSRALRAIVNLPMSWKIFGHGTVFMETHAGAAFMMPSTWRSYWPNFLRQFKFIAKPELHEAAMQDMVRDPAFWEWRKAGLAVDPDKIYDNYQYYGTFLGSVGRRLNLGIDALKVFRYEHAKRVWNSLSEEMKSDPETMKDVATVANHLTGAVTQKPGVSSVLFAPQLEVARWRRYGAAMNALWTGANWAKATPAQKARAITAGKQTLEFAAVYTAGLYANSALLGATGQKDKVNLSDPSTNDFLKFKWGGKTYDPTGGTLDPLRIASKLLWISAGWSKPTTQGRPGRKRDALMEAAVRYFQGKAHPAIGTALDFASQEDFRGRPLPFSSAPGTSKREKYTWPEYIWSQMPIPFAGAAEEFYDSLKRQGVEANKAEAIVEALIAFGFESVGTRIAPVPKKTGITYGDKLRQQILRDIKPRDPRADLKRGMSGG